jgi:adenosylcobyric acid synthase
MAQAPVLLVGDIDRGGVFASLFGTLQLLSPEERGLVKGLIINKFRGDVSLLRPGLEMLETKTAKAVLGVIPYLHNISIAQEDSVYLEERKPNPIAGGPDVAVIHLPHISNYDDFDPLESAGCNVRYVTDSGEIANPDIIIIPGTKSTTYDLTYLRRQGIDKAIIRKRQEGVPVIGICGGYQMLGQVILDQKKVESEKVSVPGLGLLDNETVFNETKTTTQVKARVMANQGLFKGLEGSEVSGYEIHMGQTKESSSSPAFQIIQASSGETRYFDGCVSKDGLVFGTYLHGLFHNQDFTRAILQRVQRRSGSPMSPLNKQKKSDPYDELARQVRENLNMKEIYRLLSGEIK